MFMNDIKKVNEFNYIIMININDVILINYQLLELLSKI